MQDRAEAAETEKAQAAGQLEAIQGKLSTQQQESTPPVKRRIEDILLDYLDNLSEGAEQQLADRFRETEFALMDCSVEEVVKVMRSPIIGTEKNKRLLRNQARRTNRLDIAQAI